MFVSIPAIIFVDRQNGLQLHTALEGVKSQQVGLDVVELLLGHEQQV